MLNGRINQKAKKTKESFITSWQFLKRCMYMYLQILNSHMSTLNQSHIRFRVNNFQNQLCTVNSVRAASSLNPWFLHSTLTLPNPVVKPNYTNSFPLFYSQNHNQPPYSDYQFPSDTSYYTLRLFGDNFQQGVFFS